MNSMELANDLGLWVTMHLSRYHGCADEHNLNDLEEYTNKRCPKVKWVLAHYARSFTYWPMGQAVERLRNMPNIGSDPSAATDLMPHYTLFKKEDHRRIKQAFDSRINFQGSIGILSTLPKCRRSLSQVSTVAQLLVGPRSTGCRLTATRTRSRKFMAFTSVGLVAAAPVFSRAALLR